MPLFKSVIPVQFSGALDQKRPDKLSLPGNFLLLENCVRKKYSLVEKRFGHTSLSRDIFGTTNTISNGVRCDTFNGDLIMLDGQKAYSYSASRDTWVDKGDCVVADVELDSVIRNSSTQALSDFASRGGISVAVWEDSRGGSRYSVFDDETGNILVNDAVLHASATRPKVVALRNVFLIGYYNTDLVCRVIPRVTPTVISAATTIVATPDTASYWNLDFFQETYAVFAVSSGSGDLTVGYIDQNGIVSSPIANSLPTPVSIGTVDAEDFCSVIGDALHDRTWILYGASSEVYVLGVTSDLNVSAEETVAATDSRNATGVVTEDGNLTMFHEVSAVSAKNHYVNKSIWSWDNSVTPPAVESADATILKSVGLASRAFLDNDVAYVNVAHDSALQPTYFTVRHDGLVVTRILGNVGGGLSRDSSGTLASGLPRVQTNASGAYETLFQTANRLQIESGGTTLKSNRGLMRGELTFNVNPVGKTLGRNYHIAGGSLFAYDGVTVFEHGFYLFPEDITKAAGAGGSLAAGTYSFRVLYEWTDGQGQLHRSAPSITVSQAAASSDKVTLTVPTLRITNRDATSVKIVVYMAAIGLSTVYYRKSETANTTATDTVAIEVATAAVTTNEILYTTGGVYENIVPPACRAIHVHKNRLWAIGLETDELWYSKEWVVGEAVAFSDFLKMPIEATGGSCNAGASLDDKLIQFKDERIYSLVGEGPLDTGAQNDYGRPQLIAADVGTQLPNSIVETPIGLIFKSSKGFYQLARNLGIKYIGAAVENYNSLTVTSAILLADENEVRFTTSDGICLVYNYFFNQWSTFSNYQAVSACNALGTYVHLKSNGTVKKEVADQYNDDGARYSMAIETSWLSFASIMGFQRVYEMQLLGDFVSHHYTKVKVAYDFEDAYTDTKYFDTRTGLVSDNYYGADPTYGTSDFYGVLNDDATSVYQFRYGPPRQKCESIKLRIEDIDTIGSTGGGSVKLMAMTFEVGRKSGTNRLSPARSIG